MSFKHSLLALCAAAIALTACGDAAPDDEPPVHQDGTAPVDAPPPGEDISPAPWDAARDRGAGWRGIGQEPGWTVEIHPGDRIVYSGDYGSTNITTPDPGPQQQGRTTIWHATTEAGDLRVTFEELPCQDVMSGEEMPFTVTVTVDGQELRGCGRRL